MLHGNWARNVRLWAKSCVVVLICTKGHASLRCCLRLASHTVTKFIDGISMRLLDASLGSPDSPYFSGDDEDSGNNGGAI
jgi:hypothetical protein